jgi:CBS domain-containing protein
MRKNQSISHVMTANPITVHHGDPISKVRKLFQENHLHHLPVVSGENLVGMISWTDLMRLSYGDAFGEDPRAVDATLDHTHKIEDMMSVNPVTIDLHAGIRDAAQILAGAEFSALPVVDGQKLVGIVTNRDLIRYLLEMF